MTDFATDWDFDDPEWVADPYPIREELRATCPMAHTKRFNEGMWLPLKFDDLVEIAGQVGVVVAEVMVIFQVVAAGLRQRVCVGVLRDQSLQLFGGHLKYNI